MAEDRCPRGERQLGCCGHFMLSECGRYMVSRTEVVRESIKVSAPKRHFEARGSCGECFGMCLVTHLCVTCTPVGKLPRQADTSEVEPLATC